MVLANMNVNAAARILTLIAFVSAASDAAPEREPFNELYMAIEEVVVDYLGKFTRPEPFSIAVADYSDLSDPGYMPVPPESLARMKKRLSDRWEKYIPPTKLKFPKPDAKDLRGITTEDGESVSVFVISGICLVDSSKARISWDYGSGPLAGIGGTYEVSKKKDGWLLKHVGTSYDR